MAWPEDLETARLLVDLGNVSDETIEVLTGCDQATIAAIRSESIKAELGDRQFTVVPDPASPLESRGACQEGDVSCSSPAPSSCGTTPGGPAGFELSAPSVSFNLCQYPIGHVGDPGFRFCADPVAKGSPYCADHHARCHTRMISRAERKAWHQAHDKRRGRLTAHVHGVGDEL